jgi:ubiquinone/menaquinone biosynthesis C-methylase UbiE
MRPLSARLLTPLLRIAFHLLYHQFAWSYDLVAAVVSLGRWQAWVRSLTEDLPGPRVLELGHGPGHLQHSLLGKGVAAFGLDESPQMGRMAQRRLKLDGLKPKLARGLAQTLPFPADYFHQVVATFPSAYILDPAVLVEIHRVLLPGAQLVVLPYASINGRRWLERAVAWLNRVTGQSGDFGDYYVEPLREAGFEVEVEHRRLRRSSLMIIKARKAAAS